MSCTYPVVIAVLVMLIVFLMRSPDMEGLLDDAEVKLNNVDQVLQDCLERRRNDFNAYYAQLVGAIADMQSTLQYVAGVLPGVPLNTAQQYVTNRTNAFNQVTNLQSTMYNLLGQYKTILASIFQINGNIVQYKVAPEVKACRAAGMAYLNAKGVVPGRDIQSWGWDSVPAGCTVQSGGDWAIHYNTNPSPSAPNTAAYTQVPMK